MRKDLNKILLEAVNRGIKLALDDFDDDVPVSQSISKVKIVDATTKHLEYEQLADYVHMLCNPIESVVINTKKELLQKILKLYKTKHIQYQVKDKAELRLILDHVIKINKRANLNWIDTINVTNMSALFDRDTTNNYVFNGDISEWNTSNVTNMSCMFYFSKFNGDISKWNTSKVKNMEMMFEGNLKFNQPIGNWNVSNVTNMAGMFRCSNFNQDISMWDISNVDNMDMMFQCAYKFNQDISSWQINCAVDKLFDRCQIKQEYKPKFEEVF